MAPSIIYILWCYNSNIVYDVVPLSITVIFPSLSNKRELPQSCWLSLRSYECSLDLIVLPFPPKKYNPDNPCEKRRKNEVQKLNMCKLAQAMLRQNNSTIKRLKMKCNVEPFISLTSGARAASITELTPLSGVWSKPRSLKTLKASWERTDGTSRSNLVSTIPGSAALLSSQKCQSNLK